jgi:hypothetical protein
MNEPECVTESGECEVCRDVDVPIFAALNENTGEWIGICKTCASLTAATVEGKDTK